MKTLALLLLSLHTAYCIPCIPQRDTHGHIARSAKQVRRFRRSHPCPATGRKTGPCHGYVVDHIIPLKKCGKDRPSNMQWQSVEAARAKDKIE